MRAHNKSGEVYAWYVKIQKLATTANSQSTDPPAAFEVLKTPDPSRDNHLVYPLKLKCNETLTILCAFDT